MTTLIVGGAGFIGSHLVDQLLTKNEKVTVIDDLSNGSMDNLSRSKTRIAFIKHDASKPYPKNLWNFDTIYYLACHPRSRSFNDPNRDLEVNVGGMINTIELARRSDARIIFSSNSGIYETMCLPITEWNLDDPKTPYDLNKLTAEEYLKLYAKTYGLKHVIFRFATVYGPRQRVTEEWHPVVPEFIKKLKNNKSPAITGDGEQTRSFTYVGDIVDGLIMAASNQKALGETMLLGSSEETSINQLYKTVSKLLKKSIPPLNAPKPEGEIQRMNYNCKHAKMVLGWEAKTPLIHGIQATIAYLEEHD